MIEDLIGAGFALMTWSNVAAMVFGTLIGIVIGALPGLTTTIGLAILIPLSFGLSPLVALGLMAGLYNGSMYGGAIPAILLNIPGTPAAIATTFDGYPMTEQGNAASALRVACFSSAVGGFSSALALLLLAPPLSLVTLAFGPPEYFWIATFGLVSIAVLIGGDPIKGMISALLGLLISSVGMDTVTGRIRFSFGRLELVDGVNIVVVLIGLFALPRVLQMAEDAVTRGVRVSDLKIGRGQSTPFPIAHLIPTWIRSSVIGIMVGILPGAGGNIAAFLSYNEAKRSDRDPESFGKGNPKGVAAAEAGNSSDNAASMIPTLTLGVPGNAIAALIMGGLLVHGLQPGPSLFRDNGEIVYGFVLQMMITSVLLFALGGMIATRIFAQVLRVPQVMLAPMIVALMCLGLYTVNNSQFELFMMIGFGVFGYILMRMQFPLPPLILGVILGGMAEQNLRTALLISRGDWWHLLASPISKTIAGLVVLVLLVPLYRLLHERQSEALKRE